MKLVSECLYKWYWGWSVNAKTSDTEVLINAKTSDAEVGQ